MRNPPFDDLDYRLSIVRRWGLLKTVQQQSVAEHCFNVARIAAWIWVEWFEGRRDMLADVYEWALHHDDEEALTTDMPSMVKPYFDEAAFLEDHKGLLGSRRPLNTDVKNCVKLADKMEGYYFLYMEKALGNAYATNHVVGEFDIIGEWATEHVSMVVQEKLFTWLCSPIIMQPRSVRHSMRGR